MTGADVIIPLAAIVGAPASKRDPWMTTEINRDAIRLITKLRSPSQLIVYPTTNSGYGTQTGDLFCTQETPLEPISLYGTTKAEAEADVLSSGNSITLRLATVFGMSPRMRLDLPGERLHVRCGHGRLHGDFSRSISNATTCTSATLPIASSIASEISRK